MSKTTDLVVNSASVIAAICALTVTGIVVRNEFTGAGKDDQSVSRPIANWQDYLVGAHRMGSATAPVKILEFGDFECPACRAFYQAEEEVLSHHSSEVALYFRHWPLPYHRFAYPSARAAECAADQGKFVEYHNILYEHQDSLGLISFDDFANRAGVPDLEKFGKCIRQSGRVAAIDSGSALATGISAQGTPAIIFNGMLLPFTPDSARLETLIREAVNTKN